MPDTVERAKQRAAESAVDLVEDGMIVGLGTGTTAAYFIAALGLRVTDGLRISGVPTSNRAAHLARSAGIPLEDTDLRPHPDLDVDGADEIDHELNVLKGGGGALLHEKIVALSSARFVVIADETKLVDRLGRRPLPVEVVVFGWRATGSSITEMSATLRVRGGETSPYVTDSGNMILDVTPPTGMDMFDLADAVKRVTGVVDHGLFRDVVQMALIGKSDGSVQELRAGRNLTAGPRTACF